MHVEFRRTFRPKIGFALEFVRHFAKYDTCVLSERKSDALAVAGVEVNR